MLVRLSDLLPMNKEERAVHELRIMETLMAKAVADKDFTAALKIMESARRVLARHNPK